MNGQQLKNSILQMAVQGKLVPQDPNDEPASVLLERIRKEKEKLIKEGKIKKEKNPSYIFRGADNLPYEKVGKNEPACIADEVPFDIPNSWEWVRLSHIFSILNGDRGKNYPAKSTLSSTGIPFISAINLDGRTVIADDRLLCMTEAQYAKLGNGKLKKGDVVVCIRGSLGKHGRYPFDKGAIASSLVILRCHSCEEILTVYIMLWLDSPLFFSEIKKYDNGTAQPNLAAKSLEQFFVPLPPLNEQHRIIQQIDNLQPYLADYNDAATKITKLNETFPEALKRSILQWAVQGKLVSQDPSDEPAEVLLERIKAEKHRLVKEGKIKKDKHESVIFRRDNSHYEKRGSEEVCIDDELPFEIPTSWEWCYLGNIAFVTKLAGFEYTKYIAPNLTDSGIPLFKGKNVQNGNLVLNFEGYIPEWLSDELSRSQIIKKCLLTPYVGTIGNIAIFDGSFKAHLGSNVGKIELINPIENTCVSEEYVLHYLRSPAGHQQLTKHKKATAQESISIDAIRNVLIPIPPLKEQKRIILKIFNLNQIVQAL